MSDQPGESEIKQIFKRLVSIPTNKQCFDCGHSHPTWASITYGVFLCIDCSAVHRSLGVHVTFIRSTVLDTNWTWLQMRAMQVGGNANARSFFNQHGCATTDAQKKYHSRAATLYRDKLLSQAQHAMRLHGTKLFMEKVKTTDPSTRDKLHIDSHDPTSPEVKEVDFFDEHAEDKFPEVTPITDNAKLGRVSNNTAPSAPKAVNGKETEDPTSGPNVEAALSTSPSQVVPEPRKAIIGAKKAPAAKRGKGLGAQRVKKDFGEIESRAQQVDKEKEELAKNIAIQETKTKEEQDKQMVNMRLAYQDMSLQRKKEEEKLMKNDPKKAAQFERLGMGFAGGKGISHSAMTDMETIQQEKPNKGNSGHREYDNYGEKPKGRRDFFDDEFEFVSSSSSWGNSKRGGDYGSKNDDFGGGWGSKNKGGSWDINEFEDTKSTPIDSFGSSRNTDNNVDVDPDCVDEASSIVDSEFETSRSRKVESSAALSNSSDAQQKFGTAKSISSEQFFGPKENDFETRQNLSRLQGSSAISSDDYFGTTSTNRKAPSYSANAPDFQDIKDGVKQGVTKVAGKLSNLANGVMSSLQDRYG